VQAESMAHSEKRYCPVCKKVTTFVCKDKASGYFCSVCGYRVKAGSLHAQLLTPVPCGAWTVIGVSVLPGKRYMDAEKLLWGFAIALVLCGVVFAVLAWRLRK